MYDKELLIEIIDKIIWSVELIIARCDTIETYEDFLRDDGGLEKLDSICMQFINIGEALKEFDKITSKNLLVKYPEIDWKAAMGLRDIINHHYFDIDAEVVFSTVRYRLPELRDVLVKLKFEL